MTEAPQCTEQQSVIVRMFILFKIKIARHMCLNNHNRRPSMSSMHFPSLYPMTQFIPNPKIIHRTSARSAMIDLALGRMYRSSNLSHKLSKLFAVYLFEDLPSKTGASCFSSIFSASAPSSGCRFFSEELIR